MNETIVKTEKLTELKNLVSEIEKLNDELVYLKLILHREVTALELTKVKVNLIEKEKQLYELIKTL